MKDENFRKEHKALKEFIQKNEEEIIKKIDSEKTDNIIERLTDQNERAKVTKLAADNAELSKDFSKLINKQIQHLGADDSRLTRQLFQDSLKNDKGMIDFEKLGQDTSVFFGRLPVMNFMLGPIKRERKERKKVVREKKQKYAEEKPTIVINNEEVTETKTKHQKLQDIIYRKIKKHKGENLFKLLVNPNSFTQTVENIFEFSFLVNDGWAGVSFDDDDLPIVIPTDPQNLSSEVKKSSVLSMNYTDFEKIVKGLNINKSIIPHRTDKEYEKGFIYAITDEELKAKPRYSKGTKRKSH